MAYQYHENMSSITTVESESLILNMASSSDSSASVLSSVLPRNTRKKLERSLERTREHCDLGRHWLCCTLSYSILQNCIMLHHATCIVSQIVHYIQSCVVQSSPSRLVLYFTVICLYVQKCIMSFITYYSLCIIQSCVVQAGQARVLPYLQCTLLYFVFQNCIRLYHIAFCIQFCVVQRQSSPSRHGLYCTVFSLAKLHNALFYILQFVHYSILCCAEQQPDQACAVLYLIVFSLAKVHNAA